MSHLLHLRIGSNSPSSSSPFSVHTAQAYRLGLKAGALETRREEGAGKGAGAGAAAKDARRPAPVGRATATA
jgi:hypothetical protein